MNHLPCCHHQQEAKETSTTCRRTATRAGQGFCLMGNCCGDSQSTCSSVDGNQIYADEEAEEKAFLAFLGKTLSQRQLESMLDSANARAGQTTTSSSSTINHSACVLIRRQEAMNWSEELPVIACRMWRWTDLDMRTDVLRRIPSCPNGRDPVYICCNPSHWFRVLQPGRWWNGAICLTRFSTDLPISFSLTWLSTAASLAIYTLIVLSRLTLIWCQLAARSGEWLVGLICWLATSERDKTRVWVPTGGNVC